MSASGAPLPEIGRLLMVLGAVLLIVGAVLAFGPRIPWLGRLPGDIHFQRGNLSFYFPLATLVLVNLLIFVVMRLFKR